MLHNAVLILQQCCDCFSPHVLCLFLLVFIFVFYEAIKTIMI